MIRKIMFSLLALSIIVTVAIVQPGMKRIPQIYFIGYAAITTILLFSKIKYISNIFYYLMLGSLLYLMCYVIYMEVVPNRGYGALGYPYARDIGLVLSILTLVVYIRNREGFEKYGKYFALTILCLTSTIYLFFEY